MHGSIRAVSYQLSIISYDFINPSRIELRQSELQSVVEYVGSCQALPEESIISIRYLRDAMGRMGAARAATVSQRGTARALPSFRGHLLKS